LIITEMRKGAGIEQVDGLISPKFANGERVAKFTGAQDWMPASRINVIFILQPFLPVGYARQVDALTQ